MSQPQTPLSETKRDLLKANNWVVHRRQQWSSRTNRQLALTNQLKMYLANEWRQQNLNYFPLPSFTTFRTFRLRATSRCHLPCPSHTVLNHKHPPSEAWHTLTCPCLPLEFHGYYACRLRNIPVNGRHSLDSRQFHTSDSFRGSLCSCCLTPQNMGIAVRTSLLSCTQADLFVFHSSFPRRHNGASTIIFKNNNNNNNK